MTSIELIDSIAEAIATMEGFYSDGSVSQRNGNPGNLRSWGTRPIANGYVRFLKPDGTPDPDAGWKALKSQIQKNIARGLTLIEFFGGKVGVYPGFSPAADSNKPVVYAQYVAGRCGISPTVPLNTIAA